MTRNDKEWQRENGDHGKEPEMGENVRIRRRESNGRRRRTGRQALSRKEEENFWQYCPRGVS